MKIFIYTYLFKIGKGNGCKEGQQIADILFFKLVLVVCNLKMRARLRKEYLLMKTIININRVCNSNEYLILLNVVNLMTSLTEKLLFEIELSDWKIIAKQSFCFETSVKFFSHFHVIRLSSSICSILIQREGHLKMI